MKVAMLTYSTRPRGGVVHALKLAERLRALGTDVTLVLGGKSTGHLAVRFYSQDDLARVLELILGRRWDG